MTTVVRSLVVLTALACALVGACSGSSSAGDALDTAASDVAQGDQGGLDVWIPDDVAVADDTGEDDGMAPDTSNADGQEPTPDVVPDTGGPSGDLSLTVLEAQWTLTGDAIVIRGSGVDMAGADVESLVLTPLDGAEEGPEVTLAIDADEAVSYAATAYAFGLVYVVPAGQTVVSLRAHVVDTAGHESVPLTVAPRAIGVAGNDCVRPLWFVSTCASGQWCVAGANDLLGACEAVPGDAPVLRSLWYDDIPLDVSEICDGSTPYEAYIRLQGDNSLPIVGVLYGGERLAVSPDDPEGFDVTFPWCLGITDLRQPVEVGVIDAAGRRSDVGYVTYAGNSLGEPCTPDLFGICAATLYCDAVTAFCAEIPWADPGVDCMQPVVGSIDATLLSEQTTGFLHRFEGGACLGAGARTPGFDKVYMIPVEAGETLTVTATPAQGEEIVAYASDTCQFIPDQSCLAGSDEPGDAAETLTYTNDGETGMSVYVVVDGTQTQQGASYELSFSRSDDGSVCPVDRSCTLGNERKLNVMILLDYSTSMNTLHEPPSADTRWDFLAHGVETLLTANGGFLDKHAHLGLMRFGHDPAPASDGTAIANETTGVTDGQAVDMRWGGENSYYECQGRWLLASLDDTVPPMDGQAFGIGTWTNGAMQKAAEIMAQSKADHPGDTGRQHVIVVVTDGAWTGVDGTTTLSPAAQNPAITAADLWDNHGVPTYVIEISGDPSAEAAAAELAAAGGDFGLFSDFEALATALANRCTTLP